MSAEAIARKISEDFFEARRTAWADGARMELGERMAAGWAAEVVANEIRAAAVAPVPQNTEETDRA